MKPRNHFIITATSTLLLAHSAFAGNTWDGGGGNANWSNAANWAGATPNYANLLSFAGTTNLITNNDGATGTVGGLTFNNGAGSFTLNGSSVALGGNITNSSTNAQTVNLPLVLDANRTVSTTSANVILGGQISGAFSLIKNQGNTLILNTAGSSFSRLQINAGTVRLGADEASSTAGGLTFSTASNATLDLNGKTQTLGNTIVIGGTAAGTATISDTAGGGLLKLGDNVLQNSGSLSNVTILAALDLNGATRSFTLGNSTTTFNVGGAISNSTGTAGLTKAGVGTLTLSGANTFNGNTTVSIGTLLVSNTTGSGTGSGAVDVSSGATLGGTGSISGAVNVSGVLSPGASIESLGTGTLTLNAGSRFKYEVDTSTVSGDLLHVTGNLNIGSNVTLDLTDLAALSQALAVDTKFTLLSYAGAWNNGTFNGYGDDRTFALLNNNWRIDYNDLTGGSNFTSDQAGATRFVTLTVVPEPSSLALGLGGLSALLVRRRRQNWDSANATRLAHQSSAAPATTTIPESPDNPHTTEAMKPRKLRSLLTAASALVFAPAAFAGNTWDGGGADGNWSTAANWGGATPDYATALAFAGTTNLTTNNDSATASVAGMTFSSGADPFTLNGSSVSLGGNITNSSTSLQTINLPLVLNGNRTIATTTGSVALGGAVSGAFNIIKTQGNTLVLNTAGSSFSLLQVNTGTVRLGVNDALPTTAGVTFATGGNAFLDLNGKSQTLGAAVTISGSAAGTATINDTAGGGMLKLGGNVVQNATGSNTVNISAALDLNGTNRNFQLNNNSGVVTVSGPISNSSGTAGVGKTGAPLSTGELILSGANTFNGSTTVSVGLLTIANSLALQNSTLGTANIIVSDSAATGLKTTVTTLTLGGLSGNKDLASLFDAANGYDGVTALTLNPGLAAEVTYTGGIADGSPGMTLTKTGAGLQILGAASSYTGGTILNEGVLRYDNLAALSTGPISFTGNATLRTGVSGNLANAISVPAGVTATFGSNNLNPILTGPLTGEGSLSKVGNGTLNISGGAANNTLSGAINVNTGTLAIDQITPSPGIQSFANMNGDITVASGATFNFGQSFQPENLDNKITISGAGTGGFGALNLFRNATASGTITLADDATISHDFNNATISGPINGTNRNLTLATLTTAAPQPGMVVSGPITLGTGGITVTGVANSGDFSIKLSGTNSYTGETRVVSGRLMLSGDSRINDTSTVRIESGAVLHLDFAGTDIVGALFLPGDPNPKPDGTYGSSTSSADNKSADFAGNGILQVGGAANNYAAWASANGIPGEPFDQDFNKDGISNGVAYALGLSPTASSQPAGVLSGNTITFTKGAEAITNADVSWIIQVSETLEANSWIDQVTQEAGNVAKTIGYNLAPIPGTPKKFARLKVVRVP